MRQIPRLSSLEQLFDPSSLSLAQQDNVKLGVGTRQFDVVVNAVGLGAAELVDDKEVRGAYYLAIHTVPALLRSPRCIYRSRFIPYEGRSRASGRPGSHIATQQVHMREASPDPCLDRLAILLRTYSCHHMPFVHFIRCKDIPAFLSERI